MVRFPESLYRRTLTQPFETSIEMVPDIAEWLVEPLADLSQFQILEVEQLQRSALHLLSDLQTRTKAERNQF